ncbi:MAG TPA: TRAM domain-containing protein [Polyangia bacterium]|nr:TRAM domain-containing protein [Polyangia bacterium]
MSAAPPDRRAQRGFATPSERGGLGEPLGGPEITVEIESLAPGGDAVGRQRDPAGAATAADGRATFVPLAAPGERVRARVVRAKDRVAWAELVAIERPGSARIEPACPLFGACGGCQWQHVSLDAQRAAKKAIVERALGSEVGAVVDASPAFGYRDRAKLAVGRGGTLGFRGRRSHDVVDVPACPLLGPELTRALPALRALARGLPADTELEAQAGVEGVHINVTHTDATGAGHAKREVDRLNAAGVVGLASAGKPAFGAAAVDVTEPGGAPLRVPASGFAQVGRAANAALVRVVGAAVGPAPGVVVELCAGSGNFTRRLVDVATAVHASDADPGAVERGRRAVPRASWSLRAPQVVADTVVLDPPREGADRPTLEAAARARRRVVYVSCDPQTLARDARRLAEAGLKLTSAVPLDLMPQTFHVEVVAVFDRPSSDLHD